jgi:hypothetical protein
MELFCSHGVTRDQLLMTKENLPFVTEKQVYISHFKQGFSSKIFSRIGLIFQSQETSK